MTSQQCAHQWAAIGEPGDPRICLKCGENDVPTSDRGQCLHAQLTLGQHGWHCAACLRTFLPSGETGAEQETVRLRYELKDVRAALQKREQEVAEIGKQLHAANNEIMSVRMERNELKARIEAMEVSDSMKTYEINVLTRENRQLDKQVKAADRQLLALRSKDAPALTSSSQTPAPE